MTHKYKQRRRSRHQQERVRVWYAVAFCTLCAALISLQAGTAVLQGATTSTVCVSVSVIGPDDGDPGAGGCDFSSVPAESSSSSSSSVASSQSSASSAVSSVPSAGGTPSGENAPSGGRRHDPEFSRNRIEELLAAWSVRHTAHTAAPSIPCARLPYEDVAPEAWYNLPVRAFYKAGFLDRTTCLFHPYEPATRAAFAKLQIVMSGVPLSALPAVSSFIDVPSDAWYAPFVEESAKQGWMLGVDNCYGRRPCSDMPAKPVSRAEAAQMIVRYYGFTRNGLAPDFIDNKQGPWYTRSIQIAADHCILMGDDVLRTVRPADILNRAEMVTMLARAELNLTYGTDCGPGPVERIIQHAPALRSTPAAFGEIFHIRAIGTQVLLFLSGLFSA